MPSRAVLRDSPRTPRARTFRPNGIVSFSSDYGDSPYAGAVRGALVSRLPAGRIVDGTHAIPAGDVTSGAVALCLVASTFPAGTTHLCVVDPGVGTARRGLAIEAGGHLFIGPDNGLLTPAAERAAARIDKAPRAWILENPRLWASTVSATFHGRDIFAPVAAHAAGGGSLDAVGRRVDFANVICLSVTDATKRGAEVHARVVMIDSFGNLVFNIPASMVQGRGGWPLGTRIAIRSERGGPSRARNRAGTRQAILGRTFADVAPGALIAYVGSLGNLELAVNGGDAARDLALARGQPVRIAPVV
ncbi:MAG: SAM hydrolase/SAM-dependent halogenase family protein [Thermoplasmatota archaeon]